jgi:hypothetical protein
MSNLLIKESYQNVRMTENIQQDYFCDIISLNHLAPAIIQRIASHLILASTSKEVACLLRKMCVL